MSKKYIIWAVLVAAVIVGAFFVISAFVKTASESKENAAVAENNSIEAPVEETNNISSGTVSAETEAGLLQGGLTVAAGQHQVIYSNNSFEPASLIIKKGDKVTFYNISGDFVWPASASHPTHKNYPGSDIEKCDTSEEGVIFDSCGKLSPGDDWSFIFNEVGSWAYHNHLQARENGVIIVEN